MTSAFGDPGEEDQVIDKESRIPLYVQVHELLRRRITERELLPRRALPPEPELMKAFGVSRATVRSAVDLLLHEGLVTREKGRGTFVAPPRHSYRFTTLTSFTEELIAKGVRPSSRILDFSLRPASEDVARSLGISEGEEIVRLERQRFADGDVVALNLSHLPRRLCPDLAPEDIADNSLYKVLEKKYDLYITKAHRDFETIGAGPYEAGLLAVAVGTPILKLVGTVSTAEDTVVDFCIEHYK